MDNQHSSGVMHVLVQGIVEKVRIVSKAAMPSRFSKPALGLSWDDVCYGGDVGLDKDQVIVRDLEAEIYALTDQFNTEQGLAN